MTTPRLKVIRVNKHDDDRGRTTFRIFWDGDLVGNVFILDHQADTFAARAVEIEGMIKNGGWGLTCTQEGTTHAK